MSQYRDDLRSARLRVETLEAQLAEQKIELTVRELEVDELRAHLGALKDRGIEVPERRRRFPRVVRGHGFVLAPVLVASAALCVFAMSPTPTVGEMPTSYLLAPTKPPPLELTSDTVLFTARANEALMRAADAAKGCHRHGLPEWGGVNVTFQSDGAVAEAEVTGPAAGTPVAECVEQVVRVVRIPSFRGSPVSTNLRFSTR